MLNFYNCIKDNTVIDEIDVYTFLDFIKNPDPFTKSKIVRARAFINEGRKMEYDKIKSQITCFTLNFTFVGVKSNETIKEATGVIYLDVDNCTDIDFKNPLIFASWLSLSGLGRGVLVKVENLNLNNFKTTYEAIGNELNIIADKHANKATQFCVHSYDNELYINNDSISYQAKTITIKSPNSVTNKKGKTKVATEIGNNINYNNISSIDFKGKNFIFFEGEKEPIAKAWIPNKILVGKRNEMLYSIAYQLKALNPKEPYENFMNFILNINRSRCIEPLPDKEVINIITKIESNECIKPYLNNPRRIIFNPNSNLNAKEKRALTNKLNGKRRTKKTINEIKECLKNWNLETQGKVTQLKLANETGKSIKTIENYYKYFKVIIFKINQNNSKNTFL